jgi:hypothetical protein
MKKKIFTILFILSFSFANALQIRGFVGASIYLDLLNTTNFNLGIDYKISSYFKPEIGGSIFIGGATKFESTDTNGKNTEFNRTMVATNFSFVPKICFGKDEVDEGVRFQVLPLFNFTKIKAMGDFNFLNVTNSKIETEKETIISNFKLTIGIGAGIYFNVRKNSNDAVAINLYYNNIEFAKEISDLKYSNQSISTQSNSLGIGAKYYLGRKKIKKQI